MPADAACRSQRHGSGASEGKGGNVREKELRIALVCFGGVSLAVYIHGISKEILKLVRASAALHAIEDRTARARAHFFDRDERRTAEYDTEAIYFELLRLIGTRLELRVIVDIIAGASAGGINGTMLARALAHDLPMGALRDLWLDDADVAALLAPEARAGRWSKIFLEPLLMGLKASGRLDEIRDPEVRRKLSLFVRSRWFKPPFDGMRMSELMYDAAASMGAPASPAASLLPVGQQLELFVTVTDHYGYLQLIEIHDPPVIQEREHRHVLRFAYRCWPSGEVETDFGLGNAPALAFAARATSSFPGAFPPAQIAEIDRMAAKHGFPWPGRQAFLERNFAPYLRAGVDPLTTSFLDGSVLSNKPFHEAIQAIRGRPAYRQIDRRLVYIDPDPRQPPPPRAGAVPGFFTTLKGALSDLPRNEPITEELTWVNGFNDRVRQLKAIIESARPHVTRLVADLIATATESGIATEQVRHWREEINNRVAHEAGFAYEGYVRLKLAAVRRLLARFLAGLVELPTQSPPARLLAEIVDAWANATGAAYAHAEPPTPGDEPAWVRFLTAFDVEFRKRRLYFMIQGLNRLYEVLDTGQLDNDEAAAVDGLKRSFYRCLDHLRHCEASDFFGAETRGIARRLFADLPTLDGTVSVDEAAAAFVARHGTALTSLIGRLGAEIDLDASTDDVDHVLAAIDPTRLPPTARRDILVNYLGFPFWDVLTLSVTNWRDAAEFDTIRVDRISPDDARTVNGLATRTAIKGASFAHFAAFFSRAYRENDYLLGRLHAVDRLIDIVCDAAGPGAIGHVDALALKRRAFRIVLDAEQKHLTNCADLIAALRRDIT
jgi:patatin-related protein